ncbi:response regulator [Microlunatus spumicola]|uniref:Response regulator n=1 Tax=Microlunatus spumicola TaxID=81499 RepID=A0ABP6XSU0_9ACTN
MRVVIAEDESLLRQGLVLMMEAAGFDVVATAATAPGLLEAVGRGRPDVVLTDLRMPPSLADDGLRAAIRIRTEHPGTGVVVLSQFVQRRYAVELIGSNPAGVGYLLKQRVADVDQFTADVRRVAEGATALDPDVVEVMLARVSRADSAVERLTGRQRQVLALIAEGRTNAAIAGRLGVSERGVVAHISNIYAELGLPDGADDHRRVLAVLRYLAR